MTSHILVLINLLQLFGEARGFKPGAVHSRHSIIELHHQLAPLLKRAFA